MTVHTNSGDLSAELNLRVWNFDIPVKQHLRTSTTIYGPYGWREDIKNWYGDIDYWQFIKEWRPGIVCIKSSFLHCQENAAGWIIGNSLHLALSPKQLQRAL